MHAGYERRVAGYRLALMSNLLIPRRATLSFGASALVAPVASLGSPVDDAALPPRAGDLLVFEEGLHAGAVIGSGDLIPGGPPILAWAMEPRGRIVRSRFRTGQILLLRVNPGDLSEAEVQFAADGVVAFSAICTHAGCAVTGWQPAAGHLLCPCHGSVYDPAAGGRVVAGPAPRSLPALPLRFEQNTLTVGGEFIGRIGGYTGRTD
jgi:rieske iron-sulfur protein